MGYALQQQLGERTLQVIQAAVLGSPISHSLSPLLHNHAYSLLNISGTYSAIDVPEEALLSFISTSLSENWTGFNMTMPLKERIFDAPNVLLDESATRIKSANTLIRKGDAYVGTSTDFTAFERLLQPFPVERIAIIGGGGTARALLGALSRRATQVDVLLRSPKRLDLLSTIAPDALLTAIPMDSSLEGYDMVVNTTPSGVADHLASHLVDANGLLFESLYNPWPTELAFAWSQLGGKVLHGIDLLVEQALDAIHLMTDIDFDYSRMREELLKVALPEVDPQRS